MGSLAISADGNYIVAALEDTSGNQIFMEAQRSALSTWAAAYEPGGGSAANITEAPSEPDTFYLYGNFGTDVTIVEYVASTSTTTDISPASLGAKEINTLEVNPDDADQFYFTVDTDEDLRFTDDGGTTYSNIDTALGFDATALNVLWSGAYFLNRYFVAGDNGLDLDVLYSPNNGSSDTSVEGATVGALANICSLEVTET